MALMFFLSGLFVWPSLARKKDWGFLRDRVLRLGLPFVFGIAVLIPVGGLSGLPLERGRSERCRLLASLLALPFWPNGPLWFIWQLLALNFIAAGCTCSRPMRYRRSAAGRPRPTNLSAISAFFSPSRRWPTCRWRSSSRLGRGPIPDCSPAILPAAALCRLLLCRRRHRRRRNRTRPCRGRRRLARHWGYALAAALVSLLLWMGLTALTMNGRRLARRRVRRRSQFRAGLRRRLLFSHAVACASRPAFAAARLSVGQCLWPLSGALRFRRLAAICVARHAAVRDRQGGDRFRRHAGFELPTTSPCSAFRGAPG